MYTNYAKIISLLILFIYILKKTRNRIPLWVTTYFAFIGACLIIYRKIFPNVPLYSPTLEYMGFLSIVGVTFIFLVIKIILEIERDRKEDKENRKTDLKFLFKLEKGNIIVWFSIVLINIIAIIIEKIR